VPQIWVKDLDTGDLVQITFGQTAADRPRWSPRNDQIVFTLGSWGRQEAPATLRKESIWVGESTRGNSSQDPRFWKQPKLVWRRKPARV
jgi:Tol biopolymer transport system component